MEYPQRQRDEAVRTATFGAAAMIYVASSSGRLVCSGMWVSLAKMHCFFASGHVSLKSCRLNAQIAHANEIVSGCGEGEYAANPREPPEAGLVL